MLTIRLALSDDCREIYEWEFHPKTREWMTETKFVSYKEHETWFKKHLKCENVKLLVAVQNKAKKIGVIKLEFDPLKMKVEIGITLNPDERGKGYSKDCIKLAMTYSLENFWPTSIFTSTIKKENLLSQNIFKSLGFEVRKDNGRLLFRIIR